MDPVTSLAVLAAVLAVVAALLGLLLVMDRRSMGRERQTHRRELAAAHEREAAAVAAHQQELWANRRELDALAEQIVALRRPAPQTHPPAVITTVGTAEIEALEPVSNQVVLSAVVGEPLVKTVAFAHGVRRALSAENRSRIAFEISHGTKVARKERIKQMRAAWRAQRREQSRADH